MSVLVVKIKIQQYSEDEMELVAMDIEPKDSPPWVWRKQAIPIEQIKRITQFDKTRCLITDIDGYEILVAEPFSSLWPKWKNLREEHPEKIVPDSNQESETISEEEIE